MLFAVKTSKFIRVTKRYQKNRGEEAEEWEPSAGATRGQKHFSVNWERPDWSPSPSRLKLFKDAVFCFDLQTAAVCIPDGPQLSRPLWPLTPFCLTSTRPSATHGWYSLPSEKIPVDQAPLDIAPNKVASQCFFFFLTVVPQSFSASHGKRSTRPRGHNYHTLMKFLINSLEKHWLLVDLFPLKGWRPPASRSLLSSPPMGKCVLDFWDWRRRVSLQSAGWPRLRVSRWAS